MEESKDFVSQSLRLSADTDPVENLLIPGQKISIEDFELIKVIGRGAFAKVFLVRNNNNGKHYAMKILKKQQLIEKNLMEKTQAER